MDQPVRLRARAVPRGARALSAATAADTDPAAQHVRVRTFVAAFLAGHSAERLYAAVREGLPADFRGHRDVRPVPAANYHVTLKFLGEIEPSALPDVLRAVEALSGHATSARVTGLTGFPQPVRARLVAAELDADPVLDAWWARLQAVLGTETRGFRPHVTVVRLRRPRRLVPVAWPEPLPIVLEAPRLYRSDQHQGGVRYRPVGLDEP